MDAAVKDRLLAQFRAYLDGMADGEEPLEEGSSEADLYTLLVEMAALRTEVRTESRLVKDALEQFRAVFETIEAAQAALEMELRQARERAETQERALLRPLLLDLLDLRDRLLAGLQTTAPPRPPWYARLCGQRAPDTAAWKEGLQITLGRLDQVLRDRRVVPMELVGRRFDARLGRVVATRAAPGTEEGIVLEEVRCGFLWAEAPLRTADVVVSKPETGA